MVPSGSPELLGDLAATPGRAAGVTLFAFGVLAIFLEPPLLALARGRRARALRNAGLAGMALATLAAALAPSYALLLAALALYGPASGLGTGLAEAALVSAHPGRVEAVLARWTLLGGVGDLLAPAILAASVALGGGWRGALLATAALAAAQAALAFRAPGGADGGDPDGGDGGSPLDAWRALRARPALLGWSAAAVLCALLDEVLVAFGALWLAGRLEADATARAAVLGAFVVGGIAGAAWLERAAARRRPATLLAASGAGCAVAYGAWLVADGWLASALALGLAGAFAAMHHPLLRARAFAAAPGEPHLVVAAGAIFGPLELLVPLAVALVADGAGLTAAMLVLLVQPLGVLAAALAARERRR